MSDLNHQVQPGTSERQRPFADGVGAYIEAGWPSVFPVDPNLKHPDSAVRDRARGVPKGYTGGAARLPTGDDLIGWSQHRGEDCLGVGMREFGDGTAAIGIDVDSYTKDAVVKDGGSTLARYESMWGPLPKTWISTARDPNVSGVSVYRAPAQRYGTHLGSDIEILQSHHRFLLAWPSYNLAAGGAPYRWYTPNGDVSDRPPRPDELVALPIAWEQGLAELATPAGAARASDLDGMNLLEQLRDDDRPMCADMYRAVVAAGVKVNAVDSGGRHDAFRDAQYRVVLTAASGHTGAAPALAELYDLWVEATGGETRDSEYERAILGAACKAVTAVAGEQVDVDPCLFDQMGQAMLMAPVETVRSVDGLELEAAPVPIREFTWRDGIGAAPYDPKTMTDLGLAQESLARVYPMVRYAYDSGQWLRRGAQRWEAFGDLTRRAVAELATLMPVGDPSPVTAGNQPTREQLQAQRRKKFYANSTAGAIAKSMVATVTGGLHPCALALSGLDQDPEILWAGGVAWDLRASVETPIPAELDPSTPHLHTALCAPAAGPTPIWDHYVATIWPDPEIRAWALRVLSIAMTGHADAALPVLYGPERTGKSSIVSLLVKLLGSYGHAADPRLLTGGENAHASIRFDLKGRRLSFIDEGPRAGFAATENLKQLTGGAEMQGNAMRMNQVTWAPTHTLVMTSNDAPQITDPALRARMRIIPCEADKAAVKAARQAITAAVWRAEAPGVLAAMMAESARWLADRNSGGNEASPGALQAEVDQMARDQNPVGEWVDQCTVPARPGTQSNELYGKFATWYEGQSKFRYKPLPSHTAFGRVLTDLGYPWHTDGPRGKHRYRPLSVLDGGPAPEWFPTGLSRQPKVDGHGEVTDSESAPRVEPRVADSSKSEPSAPENPSSSTVFSFVAEGSEGLTPTTTDKKIPYTHMEYTPPTYTDEPGENPRPSANDLQNGGSPAETGGADGSGETVGTPASDHDHDNDQVTEADKARSTAVSDADSGSDRDQDDPSRSVDEVVPKPKRRTKMTDEERTAKREADKARRAAERAQLKRDAAADASGPIHELPVAVDRAGTITPLGIDGAAEALFKILSRTPALTVDVETTGYPIGHPLYELRSVQLGDSTTALVLHPLTHAGLIRTALAAAEKLHAHSAPADLVPLAHAGLCDESAWLRMFDTVLPAKLADPSSTGNEPGLKRLAPVVLGEDAVSPSADEARAAVFTAGGWLTDIEHDTPLERSGWAQIETGSETMLRYAAADVLDTAPLYDRLPDPDPDVLARERFAQRASAKLTHRGIKIDAERVARLRVEHTEGRERQREVIQRCGVDNPGSTLQVGEKLLSLGARLPQTKTGKPSVTAAVLDALEATQGPWQQFVTDVLAYRKHATVLGLFLEPYTVLCEQGDGRARPTIHTIGTNTGRFSSVRPNIQQLPKVGGVRACMIADPGQLMIGADFSGVEIRVAAALSQDPTLLAFLREGRDLHAEIAAQVWGESAGKRERYIAKRAVFGRLYGAQVSTIAKTLGISESMAASVVDVLDDITPVLAQWSKAMQSAARSGNTLFTAYSGRVIHLPKDSPHAAGNYAIQGTAREALVDALIEWDQTPWSDAVTLPVHDELRAFVPESDADEALAALIECMETEIYGVPIIATPDRPSRVWEDSV